MAVKPDPIYDSDAPGAHIWGWMSEAELHWLHDQAVRMESVVEIGVLRGRSAFALMTGCPGPVYCIDPWHDPGEHAWRGFMELCGHFENLRAIKGWSPAAGAEVPGDVDMVFIDGSHDYDSVRADIDHWLPRTRKLICGHDYSDSMGYPGVKQAVDEVFGERVFLPDLTGIWAVEIAA